MKHHKYIQYDVFIIIVKFDLTFFLLDYVIFGQICTCFYQEDETTKCQIYTFVCLSTLKNIK